MKKNANIEIFNFNPVYFILVFSLNFSTIQFYSKKMIALFNLIIYNRQ